MYRQLLLHIVTIGTFARASYWNAECPYELFASKTPYDAVRGDIRDYPVPQNCEAVSVWVLSRHGNRNPGASDTTNMKAMVDLKDDIIGSYQAGTSQLSAQDIDMFKSWTWNSTLEVSQSYLTGEGYIELFDLAQRIRQKYPHLLQSSSEGFYVRPTNEQRTVTSAIAFVHGLTDGLALNVTFDGPWERDDVIRSYQNCDKYMQEVRGGSTIDEQLESYFDSSEFVAVQNAVQQRLGILTELNATNILAFYDLCRFDRSWNIRWQSPWCAAFTDEDLLVMEYYDDVRHYYRNGYGSWVNVRLGEPALKDLYENFEAVVQGGGRKVVSYFSHDTMLEMVISAMGLFKDDSLLEGSWRNESRLWRSSFIGAFTVNIIGVLNRCNSDDEPYRVQLFLNEKETPLCSLEGCTWQAFQNIFQPYTNSTLDFCSMD